MTSRGRQYPDGPLGPPPGRPPHIRLGAAFAEGIRTAEPVPAEFWPEAAGEFLHNMLSPEPQPGPPYVHTLVPPDAGLDEFKPYRVEVVADTPARCWFFPDDEAL